ncbi:uncharacterized protein N7484_008729 [Penicillium longicatenatum]|uniref:uncharacterized protein n=1 Tax=Penicillium longicatenatum TaxID=1561947 RepID=UPI00254808BB|nr:uncharacterized protein N7484_008729 [Penicillium longicatenatum]KAJ5635416.1 hypothetical protein N7484_008729 [Penicillium longicatenatum]
MAAVRLRKVFHYPDDSDHEHDREELDEQEQEQVIGQLQQQNDARNANYNVLFTGISLVSTITLLPSTLWASSLPERFCSLVGIFSLLASAYIMRYFPLQPDRKGKKPLRVQDESWPLVHAALVPLNGVVSGLLALYGFLGIRSSEPWSEIYLIPGAMLGAILLARQVMLSVDLSVLKDLQYGYKGA